MSKKLKLTLGCDPELFLIDIEGKLRASCGLIGGTKEQPDPLPIGEGYAVQEDNVAIEFNIPPAASAKAFVESVGKTLDFLAFHVDTLYGFRLSNLSAASFPEEELIAPGALTFGCDPDYNAWTGKRNPRPKAEDKNLRSCGGHIHIGGYPNFVRPESVIQCMDIFAGVPSVLMDNGEERKKLYGKRGAFRAKSYGCEYRVMSNFWVFTPELRAWAWEQTERAVLAAMEGFPAIDYDAAVLAAIDKNDKGAAAELCKELKLEVIGV